MPFCSNCGKNLFEGSRFCPNCGKSSDSVNSSSQIYGQRGDSIREEDYRDFIGQNSEKYLIKFRRFQIGGIESFAVTWHWPAFFFGFWWLLYRKLYLWSVAALIVALIPYLGFAGMIAWGITGNYLYYKHASSTIRSLRQMQPSSDLSMTLSQIGGVNRWVVITAIIITILGLISGIMFSLFSALFTSEKIYTL